MQVWVTKIGKPLRPDKVIAKGEECFEWMGEKRESQMLPVDQQQGHRLLFILLTSPFYIFPQVERPTRTMRRCSWNVHGEIDVYCIMGKSNWQTAHQLCLWSATALKPLDQPCSLKFFIFNSFYSLCSFTKIKPASRCEDFLSFLQLSPLISVLVFPAINLLHVYSHLCSHFWGDLRQNIRI